MTNGERIITIPRANPVNAFTMTGIVKDAEMARNIAKFSLRLIKHLLY